MDETQTRKVDIHVPVLARVEGEGALHLRIRSGAIETLRLQIYEPPRLFEKLLEGRSYEEVPDMVARICGICPVAYQISAVNALEGLFGIDPGPWVQAMRRVLYCGEWIQSHSLHIHLLAAPDYFGYDSAIAMARDYPDIIRRGLVLQGLGNAIMTLLGARSVHPVGVKVGGFHHAAHPDDVAALLARLRTALPESEALVRWAADVVMPDDDQAFTCVSMRDAEAYPIHHGQIMASDGLLIDASQFDRHFTESQVEHSTALYSSYQDKPYLVGPLARLNLNRDRLPDAIQQLMYDTGMTRPSSNMFNSMLARAIELHYAISEAVRLLHGYAHTQEPAVAVTPREGVGHGCSEAPRGLLWHRYEVDGEGRIVAARIVPPTSQNQARIEEDLRLSLQDFGLHHDDDALRLHCEKVIRNYDPCISCATHFLKLRAERL